MSAKRPSLKGKGAEIFLGDAAVEEEQHASQKSVADVAQELKSQRSARPQTPEPQVGDSAKIEKEKATFYLPMDVLEELESVWHEVRRLTHKKIKKSEIVAVALQSVSDEFRAWQNEERKRSKLMDRLSK